MEKRFHTITSFFLLLLISTAIKAQYSFNYVCAHYTLLSTIAGKGEKDDGGLNNWNPSFEGKSALNAELSRPHIAMADFSGTIYIADKEAHAVRKILPDGIITTAAGTNTSGDGSNGNALEQSLDSPNGLWVNKESVFYILDLGNGKIRKVTTDGNMTTVVADPDGISVGRGLWVCPTEDTLWYCCGSEIRQWSESEGISVFCSGFSGALGNIVQDTAGNILATDRGDNLVYRVLRNGEKSIIAGNGQTTGGGDGQPATATALDGVRGIWCLEDNSFFCATHEGSQVWYVDPQGTIHLFIDGKEGDEYHSGDGEPFRSPGNKVSEVRAVTVDYQNNVLITENDRGFVRRVHFDSTGAGIHHSRTPDHYHSTPVITTFSTRNVLSVILTEGYELSALYTIAGRRVPANSFTNSSETGLKSHYTISCPKPGRYFISAKSSEGTIFSSTLITE